MNKLFGKTLCITAVVIVAITMAFTFIAFVWALYTVEELVGICPDSVVMVWINLFLYLFAGTDIICFCAANLMAYLSKRGFFYYWQANCGMEEEIEYERYTNIWYKLYKELRKDNDND